jgi:hypothetical protein
MILDPVFLQNDTQHNVPEEDHVSLNSLMAHGNFVIEGSEDLGNMSLEL